MYAVFQVSGHQYRAAEGDVIDLPTQDAKVGDKIDLTEVLLLKKADSAIVGTPTVTGAKIQAEVLANALDDKVLVYKFKRRTKYRRLQGHRQGYTQVKIKKIISPKA